MKAHKPRARHRTKKEATCVLLVGSSRNCPDLEYASGFRAADPVVFLQRGTGKYLVVPPMEQGRAEKLDGLTVLTPGDIGIGRKKRRGISEWALGLLKHLDVRRVTVPFSFPHGVAERLRKSGHRVDIAGGPVFPGRAVKTPAEIRKIRQSQQAAVIAMRAAVSMISHSHVDRHGILKRGTRALTAEDVRRTITVKLLEHDGFCSDAIVACGKQAADPHTVGAGPLRANEAIVIDIYPQHLEHGYWGDLTRTVVKGGAPPRLKKMYQAVRAAQTKALACIKPGVKCATVHRAAVAEFDRRGFGASGTAKEGFIHSTGHGVGLAIHEAPSLAPGGSRLRSGHVVTVEPGLYYRDIGGIRIEDTVVVTAGGWRHLVPCEKRLEV